MANILDSFKPPYKTPVLEGQLFSYSWEWFFRSVAKRLYALGNESVQQMSNNLQALSFATTDVDTTNDIITEASHPYTTGLRGKFTTTGTLPAGLSTANYYYVINTGANDYAVASSNAAAQAGTKVDLTDVGTGTHTFNPYPEIVGAKFDKNGVTAAFFEYLCQRVTTGGGAVEYTEAGILIFVYEPTSQVWTKVTVSEANPDDAGITIDILDDGQVYYNTTSIAGTASISSLHWRARTLSGKNISYSKVNR